MKYVNSGSNSFLSLSVYITAIKKENCLMPCEMSLAMEISTRFLQCVTRILKIEISNSLPKKPHPKRMRQFPHSFYKLD